MINRTSSSTLFFAALMLSLSACQRTVEPTVVSNGQPAQVAVVEPAPMQSMVRDPSLPDASSVFAAEAAAEKAKADALAAQEATVAQQPTGAPAMVTEVPASDKPLTAAPVDAVPATRVN